MEEYLIWQYFLFRMDVVALEHFMEIYVFRGKFGQVFRLVEKKTGKVWAGKFFKAYSAKEKENIRDEISIMNCLHHPKLVQCVDEKKKKANIVMVLEM